MSKEPVGYEVELIDQGIVVESGFDPFEVDFDYRPKDARPGDLFRHTSHDMEMVPNAKRLFTVDVELRFGKLPTW